MNKLFNEIAESGTEYLPRLVEGLGEVAEFLRQGKENEGIERLSQSLEGLEWVQAVVNGVPVLLQSENIDVLETLKTVLVELEQAWSDQDHTSLADLIEYELVPSLENLYEWFSEQMIQFKETLRG
ncbi:hypothetical protein H1S01_08010 [Heliobacterium chlorum]|uniref:DUF8042 domain-containing protein n=1 Tax=Heliobacterium chlorum TaxID=2698 RepID=A0ABR7T0Y9_HELCL|nr:hypothetical protein [Heliobacterium chlorum]MBC9784454.1 hypothetical protein [Heliobacterium chlorum]